MSEQEYNYIYLNDDTTKKIEIASSVSIIKNANEELDTYNFVIPSSDRLDLQPMDSVELHHTNGNVYYFVIDTWVEEEISIHPNVVYSYTIKGISETIKLERSNLPTLKITIPISGRVRQLYWHCEMVFNLYVKRYFKELSISDRLKNFLLAQDEKQYTFTNMNAKEYFNMILEPYHKLITIVNHQIDYLDFADLSDSNEIDAEKLDTNTRNQSVGDYFNNIKCYAKDCQSETQNVFTEMVGIRSPESANLTTENGKIYLQHNIDEIVQMTVYAWVSNANADKKIIFTYANIYGDKYKRVVEKQIYDTLYPCLLNSRVDDTKYKRSNIYYTRGSNVIDGLFYNDKTWFLGLPNVSPAIENIIQSIAYLDSGESITLSSVDGDTGDSIDIRDLKFTITYKSSDDITFTNKKNEDERHFSEIVDNQANATVNASNYSLVESEKVKRLGNEVKEINAFYTNKNDAPKLLDHIDEYVLAKIEQSENDNGIIFKGYLYKNYVQKNLYYGVNAKRRSYNLISGNEAIERKDLFNYNVSFKLVRPTTNYYISINPLLLTNVCVNNATSVINTPILYNDIILKMLPCFSTGNSEYESGNSVTYQVQPKIDVLSDKITFNFKFYDNINVGMRLVTKGYDGKISTSKGQTYVPYTDENGRLESVVFYVYYLSNLNVSASRHYFFQHGDELPAVNSDFLKNIVNIDYNFSFGTMDLYKDNGEKLNITQQLSFLSNDDVVIAPNFVNNTRMNGVVPPLNLRVYVSVSKDLRYKKGDTKVLATAKNRTDDLEIDYTELQNFLANHGAMFSIKLYNKTGYDLSKVTSWAIGDENRNLWLGVNSNQDTIYLSIEKE